MRALWLAALLVGAVLAGCTDTKRDPPVQTAVEPPADLVQVDAAALLADLRSFAEAYGERAGNLPAHVGARDWLAQQFESAGLQVWRQEFTNGIPQENIVGIHWGTTHRDQWVVVGAHYDIVTMDCGVFETARETIPVPAPGAVPQCLLQGRSQGAYDDGSGTLMTVHLAKAFANVTTDYTIAFVAFDGEERGLQGSEAFHREVGTGNTTFGNVTFRAMLDLDMFGLNCPGVEAPIYFDSNSPELDAEVKRLAEAIDPSCAPTIKYQGITLGRSDYHWFYIDESGIPTGFFISDFEEWQLPANVPYTVTPPPVDAPLRRSAYPWWHLEDTYETMELMAGSPEDLRSGFQFGVSLAAGVLQYMAYDENALTAEPPQ